MKGLHGITIGNVEAFVWYTIIGGNGRTLDHGTAHLFRVERNRPGPIPREEERNAWGYGRRYWLPWATNTWRGDALNPLCGRIKSAARFARVQDVADPEFVRWGRRPTQCAECDRIANHAGSYIQTLNARDPWSLIPLEQRRWHIDPVTNS